MASYLLFEGGFCRDLIACGYRDAMAERDALTDFFLRGSGLACGCWLLGGNDEFCGVFPLTCRRSSSTSACRIVHHSASKNRSFITLSSDSK